MLGLICPGVGIGLSNLPKTGGQLPPAPSGLTALSKSRNVAFELRHSFGV